MSTAPLLTYLALDASYDPIFDPNAVLTNAAAVQQAILTKVRWFFGEWWEATNDGLPVFQVILGQLATQRQQAAMSLAIQQQIETVQPWVISVASVNFNFDDGKFSFAASVNTVFGQITVQYAPALSASLDT